MNPQDLLQKSKSLLESKQYSMAKEYAQAVLEHNQNDIDALFVLAQCDEALGKTKAMASSLFRILSIDTSNVQALEKLRNAGFLGKDNANAETELVERITDDGSVYLLSMRDDKIDGFGAIVKSGMFYTGMFKDNNMHGHGLMKGTNGSIFVGNFNKGTFSGEGTLITDNYQVKSTFMGSEPDGKSPVEIKWRNGNSAIFRLKKGQLGDINSWSDIKFFKSDGVEYKIDLRNGDAINMETGEALIRNLDKNSQAPKRGNSKKDVQSTPTRVSNIGSVNVDSSVQNLGISYNIVPPKDNGSDFWRVDSSDGVMFYVGIDRRSCYITAPGKEVSYYRNKRMETPSWNGFKKPKGPTINIPDEIKINGEVYKITRLEKQCFYGCSSIKNITMPSGLLSIGFFALVNTSIEMLDIPESVKILHQYSFPRLNTLRLQGNPPQIGVLQGVVDFATCVMIPLEKKDMYENAPYWQTMNLTTY